MDSSLEWVQINKKKQHGTSVGPEIFKISHHRKNKNPGEIKNNHSLKLGSGGHELHF